MKRSKLIRFLLFGLIPVGVVILFFSVKMVKKTFSGKVILEIPYSLKSGEFVLETPGIYSIWHRGAFFTKAPLDEFRPVITDLSTGLPVKLSSRLFRPNANNGRNARMEIFRFSATPGTYRLELKEGSSISKVEQRVIDAIPAGKFDEENYFIQVRESQPFLLSFSGIAGIALGGVCMIGGLVTGILTLNGQQIFN